MARQANSAWEALVPLGTVFGVLGIVTLAASAAHAQPAALPTWQRVTDDPFVVGQTYRWSVPTTAAPSAALLAQLSSDFDGLRFWSTPPADWPADDSPGRTYFEGRPRRAGISFKASVPRWTLS